MFRLYKVSAAKKLAAGLAVMFILAAGIAQANNLPDRDRDGIPDSDELNVYFTNPDSPDTDEDGYGDWQELNKGYSPYIAGPISLETADSDKDGLSDRLELDFHTNPINPDTDNDGYADGAEIEKGYDPLSAEPILLAKRLEINLGKQELSYFLGGVRLGIFSVSTGKTGMPTPKGYFEIDGKTPRAWSSYGLWMPWWMSLYHGKFGIHELPEWPNGYKEGANHLGRPVSHGCVRLGVGPAKLLYDWTPIGTPVFIY